MSAESLISRLDKVKATGSGRWQAKCPAHLDKGPSLSIRELDDGRILVHCFAGCSAVDVVESVGLEISDLFPTIETGYFKPVGRPFSALSALRAVAFEALVVAAAASSLLAGSTVNGSDRARLILAVSRIQAAVSAVSPKIGTGDRG